MRWVRVALGVGSGVLAAGVVAAVLGLVTGRVVGAEDNGDGVRLLCGIGLTPRTVDGLAAWKAGVVTDFAVGARSCAASTPSSAGLVLRAVAWWGSELSLVTVGWCYVVLVGVVVGTAAWVASVRGPWRAAVVAVPLAPLALVAFSRFFVSTYGEPAGLLGTLAVACGVAALATTRPADGRARTVALVLVALGGGVAATAKPGYLPVLAVAVLVCATVAVGRRRPRRLDGPLAVGVVLLAVAVPVVAAVGFQDDIYGGANVHDVVFTLALPELGPDGPAELGLPPEAAAVSGHGYFNGPPLPTAPWWSRAIHDQPDVTRADAQAAMVRHPSALFRALGVGLQATWRADLPYLAAGPADAARVTAPAGDPGWSGASGPEFRAVLDGSDRPAWVPSVAVVVALLGAASTPWWRRRAPGAARWTRAAGLAAVGALGLVAAALAGDGYFEVFKHVWLASYLLVLAATCLCGAIVTGIVHGVRRRFPVS